MWAQTLLLNAHALRIQRERYGRAFRDLQAEWDASQFWKPERMRSWQDERVRKLVRFAYERVPYYRRSFDAHGVSPNAIHGVEDLPRLPILTKEDVRAAGAELLAEGMHDQLVHGHTSGTTGSPLSLMYDRGMCVANNVADWRQKQWAGLHLGTWHALILGRVVVPTNQRQPPYWRANHVHRQLWMSAFHMSDERLPLYADELRRRGVRFLEGYPSTLYILARHLLRAGTTLPMHAAFTSSETLLPIQREAISKAFECEVFDFYGLAERVLFAAECEQHDGKHVFEEYGVTEVVDDSGAPVRDGQPGWLVGTSLWNFGMPLIRYRTSDISSRIAQPCACGRGLGRIAAVTTKAEDIIVTPDGRFISPSVLTHPFKPFDQLVKSQIVQDESDHVLVKLVPSASFTDEHRDKLVAGLRERLGTAMRISVDVVQDIPAERSGKFRWIISRVPHECGVSWEG